MNLYTYVQPSAEELAKSQELIGVKSSDVESVLCSLLEYSSQLYKLNNLLFKVDLESKRFSHLNEKLSENINKINMYV